MPLLGIELSSSILEDQPVLLTSESSQQPYQVSKSSLTSDYSDYIFCVVVSKKVTIGNPVRGNALELGEEKHRMPVPNVLCVGRDIYREVNTEIQRNGERPSQQTLSEQTDLILPKPKRSVTQY